jgi:hypothetical protein
MYGTSQDKSANQQMDKTANERIARRATKGCLQICPFGRFADLLIY